MSYDLPNAYDDHLTALEQNAVDTRTDHALALLAYMETHCPHWLTNIERRIAAGETGALYEVAQAHVDNDGVPF